MEAQCFPECKWRHFYKKTQAEADWKQPIPRAAHWLLQPCVSFTQKGWKCPITFTSPHQRGKLVLPTCKRKILSPILSETQRRRRCHGDETDNQSGNIEERRWRRRIWFTKWHFTLEGIDEADSAWGIQQNVRRLISDGDATWFWQAVKTHEVNLEN